MANNSIGAYAQGGLNEIGAYEKAAAATGRTVNMALATLDAASAAAAVKTNRAVQASLATLSATSYTFSSGVGRTVNMVLKTLGINTNAHDIVTARGVNMSTATLGITEFAHTITLTIKRTVDMGVATLRAVGHRMTGFWMDGAMPENEWWRRRRIMRGARIRRHQDGD
jgi:hypothetical protein